MVKVIVNTSVTTAGGAGAALARTSRSPTGAAPMTDLRRDPGGSRRIIVPALAQICFAETADVAVEKRKTKISLQNPHLHPDHPLQNNLVLSL